MKEDLMSYISYYTPQTVKELQVTTSHIQEWLCLHGYNTGIDGDWGPATNRALKRIAENEAIDFSDYKMTDEFWFALTYPLREALATPLSKTTLAELVGVIAAKHHFNNAKEIGGNNKGPWVRTYMAGNSGVNWPWCAGFVKFVLAQACFTLKCASPIATSYSTSMLVKNARAVHRFQEYIENSNTFAIFALKGGITGYKHTGFAYNFTEDTFETIEGNTNYGGSSDGDAVCRRIRATERSHFITL
jgi:hypothetical protein